MSGETVMEHLSNQPHQNEENAIRYLTNFGKDFIALKKHDDFSCTTVE